MTTERGFNKDFNKIDARKVAMFENCDKAKISPFFLSSIVGASAQKYWAIIKYDIWNGLTFSKYVLCNQNYGY